MIDNLGLVAAISIFSAGIGVGLGAIGPAIGEGLALAQALSAIAQQPDEANNITRTLFVGLALVETTAIYTLVIALIILFVNPFWIYFINKAGG